MKLDFVVTGFSKCGTTTLCSLLAEHPEICFAKEKEPGFFAGWFWKGWEWYERQFEHSEKAAFFGEGSTDYSTGQFCERACERILQYFPEARFIFIARNPLKRLESSFREMHTSGYKYGITAPYSLGQTLRKFPNMIEDTLYWERINVYRKHVPDSRIHVLFLEDFAKEPAAELARCLEFIGADPSMAVENSNRRENPRETKVYDSRLMRLMHRHKWSRRLWHCLPTRARERMEQRLGLRRPFKEPVQWDSETREWVFEKIAEDSLQFLEFYGKSADHWNLAEWTAKDECSRRAAA